MFWCHEDSPLIHPVGWAKGTGQKLDAPLQYHDRIMKGLREKDDATADLFLTPERFPRIPNCYFQEGMKLEAIDPLNLSDICVATVMQVRTKLRYEIAYLEMAVYKTSNSCAGIK